MKRALKKAGQQATLDKKLLVGVRSPAKPLAGADFDRIRACTRRKLKQLEAA